MKVDTSKIIKILSKIKRKDPALFQKFRKKIKQLMIMDPNHFKNLRHDASDLKRVHIGSFVLIFSVIDDVIICESFTHHDNAYKR